MHAAQVTAWGSAPVYVAVSDPPAPSSSQIQLRVLATGVHQLVRSRAAGKHYTSKTLPHTPGVDGVGEDASTGTLYYFSAFSSGSFQERVNVERSAAWPLSTAGTPSRDEIIRVAALMNPAMSSWMALATRTPARPDSFSIAILGVTSASGRVAVEVARRAFGATRVVGIARNAAAMAEMKGLDERIALREGDDTDWSALGEVDVVLDYVYGTATLSLLKALQPSSHGEIQYVQVGSVSGEMDIPLPGMILRSKRIALRGAGPGSWSMPEYAAEAPGMMKLIQGYQGSVSIADFGFGDLEKVWDDRSLKDKRVVFTSEDLRSS